MAHYNISQMIYFRKQTVAWPMSVQQRDSHSRQVQRTESFNLIFRFSRVTTIYVVRPKKQKIHDLSNLSRLQPNLWIFTRIPATDSITSTGLFFVPLCLSRSLSVCACFFPLSSFPFFFLGPVVDVLCHVFSRTHAEAAFIKSDTL